MAEAEDGARWTVSAGFCVFAAVPQDPASMMMPTSPDDPVRKPAILRLPGEPAAGRFVGSGDPNAYYHADAVADGARGYSFEEARQWLTPPPAADPAAVELTQSPWESADPAAELDRRPEPGRRDEPWKVFRLKTSPAAVAHAQGGAARGAVAAARGGPHLQPLAAAADRQRRGQPASEGVVARPAATTCRRSTTEV